MIKLVEGNAVNFKIDKQLIYVRCLGSGGTGEVHLFKEPLTGKKYAIKKFHPIPENDGDGAFERFVDEIKILVDLYHQNIVRVYTYYLFPNLKSGYLQMEFIEGDTIDVYLQKNPTKFDNIFRMAIDAFSYLERNGILHRDIRTNNLLISNDELKVIDFGFGKKIDDQSNTDNSVFIDYPVSVMPEEISFRGWEYNESTEIYFLGSLFKKMQGEIETLYKSVIEKMCEIKKEKRYKSFQEIKKEIYNNSSLIEFSEKQRKIYQLFADSLVSIIKQFNVKPKFETNNVKIIQNLNVVFTKNFLEEKIQNNQALIDCFLSNGNYTYIKDHSITELCLKEFCTLLNSSNDTQQELILSGIRNRLSDIKTIDEFLLPF